MLASGGRPAACCLIAICDLSSSASPAATELTSSSLLPGRNQPEENAGRLRVEYPPPRRHRRRPRAAELLRRELRDRAAQVRAAQRLPAGCHRRPVRSRQLQHRVPEPRLLPGRGPRVPGDWAGHRWHEHIYDVDDLIHWFYTSLSPRGWVRPNRAFPAFNCCFDETTTATALG